MTFEEMIIKYCEERLMFPEQAEAVLEKVLAIHPDMKERLRDQTSDYPEVILILLVTTTQQCALKWFDENLPQAFNRVLFED